MTLSVGFLGYRFMGKTHANALDRLPMFFPDAPDVERDVLVGRDEDAVADAADQLGFSRTASDWRDVVDEVDVFYNLGPNHLHVEPTIAALENDVHVFCEKPLAPTLDGAERVCDAATASDAVAGIAYNYRFVPALRLAKRLIDAGELGEIYRVRARYLQDWQADRAWSWRNDAALAGSGSLGDVGSHSIDLARWLVGDIDRVCGHRTTLVDEREDDDGSVRPVTTDDEYSALARFENGAMGVFEGSRLATGRKGDNGIEIYGSAGSVRFQMERLNELEVLTGDDRGHERVLVTDEDHPYMDAWWPTGHPIGWEHTFVHENYEFLRAVAGHGSFSPSLADGRDVQRVLDAVIRSDDGGAWVSV